MDHNGVTFSFQVVADYMTRGKVRRLVETYCAEKRLRCKVKEIVGSLETTFIFTLTGSTFMTNLAADEIAAWLEANSTKEKES